MFEANVRAILLDIEGTTTPVEFVYEVLFPYARHHLRTFIEENCHSEDLRGDIAALRTEYVADKGQGLEQPAWGEDATDSEVESVTQYVYWLMDRDRKSTALKSLQGKIWQAGYLGGSLLGQVYPDVLRAVKRWREQQRSIYIFSSGSVLAQKLLFAHTTEGDFTAYISGYFDTTTGAKTEAASYLLISETIGHHSSEVVFVSDTTAELDAAVEAGMQTALCVRSGSPELAGGRHRIVHTFDPIFP